MGTAPFQQPSAGRHISARDPNCKFLQEQSYGKKLLTPVYYRSRYVHVCTTDTTCVAEYCIMVVRRLLQAFRQDVSQSDQVNDKFDYKYQAGLLQPQTSSLLLLTCVNYLNISSTLHHVFSERGHFRAGVLSSSSGNPPHGISVHRRRMHPPHFGAG